MIYFVQCGGSGGPIKVGFTENEIEQRISQMQTGCPYELKLIWKIPGGQLKESEIHRNLEHAKIRGEWFSADAVFEYINENPVSYIGDLSNQSCSYEISEQFDGKVKVSLGGCHRMELEIDSDDKVIIVWTKNESVKYRLIDADNLCDIETGE